MKVLTLLIACLLFSQYSHAQNELPTRDYVLGGGLSFRVQSNYIPPYSNSIPNVIPYFSGRLGDSKNTAFSISPYAGKIMSPSWLLGLQFDFRTETNKYTSAISFPQPDTADIKQTSNLFGIGVFGRYSINPENRLVLYLQPYLRYQNVLGNDYRDSDLTQKSNIYYIDIGIGTGLLYNITELLNATVRVGSLSYVVGKWNVEDSDQGDSFSTFGLNLNLASILLGIEFKL